MNAHISHNKYMSEFFILHILKLLIVVCSTTTAWVLQYANAVLQSAQQVDSWWTLPSLTHSPSTSNNSQSQWSGQAVASSSNIEVGICQRYQRGEYQTVHGHVFFSTRNKLSVTCTNHICLSRSAVRAIFFRWLALVKELVFSMKNDPAPHDCWLIHCSRHQLPKLPVYVHSAMLV